MKEKHLLINYKEYSCIGDLSGDEARAARAAIEATGTSYSPYSHFSVGAAAILEDGTLLKGSNQENAAYPSGLCAERTVLFYAGAQYPDVPVRILAIAACSQAGMTVMPVSPCGACRQVMAEVQKRAGKSLKIILVGKEAVYVFDDVSSLLPFIFDSLD